MIGFEDAPYTYEYEDYFKILPSIITNESNNLRIKDGVKVSEGFSYSSDNNDEWMTRDELQKIFKIEK